MTKHMISAIIGYWRSGASSYEISQITYVPMHEIEEIISEYQISEYQTTHQPINHLKNVYRNQQREASEK